MSAKDCRSIESSCPRYQPVPKTFPLQVALLVLVAFLTATSVHAQPSWLTDGLVAYYPFNGNADDESGNGNSGSITGAQLAVDRFGTPNRCLFFAGPDSRMRAPTEGYPLGDRPRTLSVWVRLDEKRVGGLTPFASYGTSTSAIGTGFGIGYADDLSETFSGGNGVEVNIVGNQKFTIGKWHHCVAAYSEHRITLYLDGRTADSRILSDSLRTRSGLTLGESFSTGANTPVSLKGSIDDVRIYNRALSDLEVNELFAYESAPRPLLPRSAQATAQIVNGFVVGIVITDHGYGYSSPPIVTISGGGGTDAQAVAAVADGRVTTITIINAGKGYTSAPTVTMAPPPFPPRRATGTAEVVNGFVVSGSITDGGFGYSEPPVVRISGGGGSGATATATVANGIVTGIVIDSPGSGYTSTPRLVIASPPFSPELSIAVSRVRVNLKVLLGRKYQIDASTDLKNWTPVGPPFVAEDEDLVQEFDVDQVGRYFRINQVP